MHGRVDAGLQAGFAEDAMWYHRPSSASNITGCCWLRVNERRDQALTFRGDQDGIASGQNREAVSGLHDGATHGVASWPTVHAL